LTYHGHLLPWMNVPGLSGNLLWGGDTAQPSRHLLERRS
jgi:hypothetical protein